MTVPTAALTLDKAFKPRHNSIGFLRWLMALAVIFSHAGPLAGFYGSKSLGTQWSDEQSFGGVAVAGFFFLSGFLITKVGWGGRRYSGSSGAGPCGSARRSGRRSCLTAFVLAPIAWLHQTAPFAGTSVRPWSRR